MITVAHAYGLLGLMFLTFSLQSLRNPTTPRRWLSALFWGLLALSMLAGSVLGDLGNGILVLILVIVVALGGPGRPNSTSQAPAASDVAPASRHGNKLFIPAIAVPVLTVGGTLAAQHTPLGQWLISERQTTLVVLGLACMIVLAGTMIWLKPAPMGPVREANRLMTSIGWATLMPQMLAALGAVFLASDVGGVVGSLFETALPLTTPFAAVAAYCLGMALFTIIMGNAFAAFPVMTAAVGLPILVHQFGGNPAIICAIGMLAGFCGTLMTPMAANFNVVPANLLDLPDRDRAFNGVIRAQAPTAAFVLLANILLIYLLAFRF